MALIQLGFFIIFAILTTIGYKKNNRNMMLLGAVIGTLGFVGLEFMFGFDQGLQGR